MMRIFAGILSISSLLIFSSQLVSCDSPPTSPLQDKCGPEFTKLGECLSFATAKADTPSPTCCGSVTEIRNKDAVCLCYIIQQAHAGGSSVTSLGLQMDRLIQLPSACKLANANVSDCPKLLNLTPSSPDYAIFTNTTKATTTPAASSGSSTGSSAGGDGSGGVKNKIHYAHIFTVAMISALSFVMF